jgi:nucleoside 2-deoxyribosyltransferase
MENKLALLLKKLTYSIFVLPLGFVTIITLGIIFGSHPEYPRWPLLLVGAITIMSVIISVISSILYDELRNVKVYIICPVRNATSKQRKALREYIEELESIGHDVFYPSDHAPQNDPTGWGIVSLELQAIKECDEVHVYWDTASKGSHFDLGIAMALNKPIILVDAFQEDGPEKSYYKAINKYIEEHPVSSVKRNKDLYVKKEPSRIERKNGILRVQTTIITKERPRGDKQ